MEKLQGPINPCLFEEENAALGLGVLTSAEEGELRFEQQQQQQAAQVPSSSSSLLDETMPFLEMLQTVECASLLQDPSFQLLQSWRRRRRPISYYEVESCSVPNEMVPKAEPPRPRAETPLTMTMNMTNPSSSTRTREQMAPPASAKEKRKRKRTKLTKNKQQVETQRMTHIAVERNRRRQMNDHLNALRSLMPSTYIQRGDQASIIGGAIDFVKELEQLLQSLQAHKRVSRQEDSTDVSTTSSSSSNNNNNAAGGCELADVDVDVVVIQNHVNLKIHCQRKPGQLIRALLALEDLSLSVLHLNITSSHHTSSAHYSLNLKIEDECNLRSATEIAGAVHQIFNLIYNLEI